MLRICQTWTVSFRIQQYAHESQPTASTTHQAQELLLDMPSPVFSMHQIFLLMCFMVLRQDAAWPASATEIGDRPLGGKPRIKTKGSQLLVQTWCQSVAVQEEQLLRSRHQHRRFKLRPTRFGSRYTPKSMAHTTIGTRTGCDEIVVDLCFGSWDV